MGSPAVGHAGTRHHGHETAEIAIVSPICEKEAPLFETYCPVHESNVLIFPSSIDELVNTERGIVVRYHCSCGHRSAFVTGKRAEHTA